MIPAILPIKTMPAVIANDTLFSLCERPKGLWQSLPQQREAEKQTIEQQALLFKEEISVNIAIKKGGAKAALNFLWV